MEGPMRWEAWEWRWRCHDCPDYRGRTAPEATEHAWREHGLVVHCGIVNNVAGAHPMKQRSVPATR